MNRKSIRPEHYGGDSNPFEAIKIIDHYNLNFNLGNVIKYILNKGVDKIIIKTFILGGVSRSPVLFRTSFISTILNYVGRRKKICNCPGCEDSFWWKKDTSMAFKNEQESFTKEKINDEWITESLFESRIKINSFKGLLICEVCFLEKSEDELYSIFEQHKNNRSDSLLRPIRTITNVFKKELAK